MRLRFSRSMGISILALLLASAGGCGPMASFVATGPTFEPRPEDAPVRVFLTRPPDQPYTEIGVVEVAGGDLAWRAEEAKYAARARGGDAIILLRSTREIGTRSSSETVDVEVDDPETSDTTTATIEVPVTDTYSYQRDLYIVARLGE